RVFHPVAATTSSIVGPCVDLGDAQVNLSQEHLRAEGFSHPIPDPVDGVPQRQSIASIYRRIHTRLHQRCKCWIAHAAFKSKIPRPARLPEGYSLYVKSSDVQDRRAVS